MLLLSPATAKSLIRQQAAPAQSRGTPAFVACHGCAGAT